MYENQIKPKNSEIILEKDEKIFSKTDLNGVIIECNDYFQEISGWSEKELVNSPHNIIRHPDMPKSIFRFLWERIKSGDKFYAIVKNMAKNGEYYWVIGYYEPVFKNKEIIAYSSYRRYVTDGPKELVSGLYKEMLKIEKETGDMDKSFDVLKDYLFKNNTTYDKWILKLIEKKGILSVFGVKPKFK